MNVKLTEATLAFPRVFVPESYQGDPARYSVKVIIEPGSANHELLQNAIKDVAASVWPKNTAAVLENLYAKGKVSYHLEEKLTKDGEVVQGFEGMYYLSAGTRMKPLVVGRDAVTELTGDEGLIASGCLANVLVDIWGSVKGGRINASLLGVQYVSAGTSSFAGRVASHDAIEPVEENDEVPF